MTSLLLFVSGFAALAYQVLWMRELTVLLGASAPAAAAILAAFFAGLAGGAAVFARSAHRVSRPLRLYGLLEIGIAATALLVLGVLHASAPLHTALFRQLADSPAALMAAASLFAIVVLALPTMLMGATLPAMVQHDGRGAWLYGMNTAGAAAGAFATGFYLPPVIGFRRSYLLAIALNVAAGLAAILIARRRTEVRAPAAAPALRRRKKRAPGENQERGTRLAEALAFASGALTIGLEVTWFRMFAQVLDNSVYAFSIVVVVALVAFAAASLLVARLHRGGVGTGAVAGALAASAVAAALQGPAFVRVTDGLAPVTSDQWSAYVRTVFLTAAAIVGIPGVVAGLVFPMLLRRAAAGDAAAAPVARLLALNTVGAIAGSLLTTFFVLRWAGAWGTSAAIGIAYAVAGLWVAGDATARRSRPAAAAALVVTVAAAAYSTMLPRVRLDAERAERLLEVRESTHGTVAVTETRDGRLLRLNNSYSLGGTTDRIERERIQTLIPLLLHPDPSRVFFLGLGTGITAGEALRHPVERVVVCELVPEVVRASRRHFGEWTRGLASDRRVELRVEDGRHYLAGTDEQFDVVVSDLFVPWHAGTGMLYALEHFETIRARLRPGGLFAQWLPLFQLNERDFEVIARTLLAVFPHVVMWRGDFYANRPIVALVASAEPMRFDATRAIARARTLAPSIGDDAALTAVLPFYAGNLGAADGVVSPGPLNTDQQPLIEFLSPRAQWGSGADGWFVSMNLVGFLERARTAVPVERDPYLSGLTAGHRRYVDAGHFYYRAIVERLLGEDGRAMEDLGRALERLPENVQVQGPFMALEPLLR